MYTVIKKLEISAAHMLELSYDSKCSQLHGHNWQIEVTCKSKELNQNGMVVDFAQIKQRVKGMLDHRCLNDKLTFNPTAENIARWICLNTPYCVRVKVQESKGNIAIYDKEE